MKRILLAVIFLSTNLFGQETKKVTEVITTPAYSKEVYSVLKTNKSIRHGEYVRYGWNNKIAEKGLYESNIRVGLWEFYDFNGELEQKYNYTDRKIEILQPSDFKYPMQTQIDGVYIDKAPDEMPVFIGGQSRQTYIMMMSVRYPVEAKRQGTQGKVIISAIITTDGQLIGEKIEARIGSGCDEEALKTIKNFPDDWIPAKFNGGPVNVKIFIPVIFKLD